MASENRTATRALDLFSELEREPYKFDFFQLLRRLECVLDDQPRIGQSPRPADDPIRLAQEPFMTFAPNAVSKFEHASGGRPPRLQVLFAGLFGPNGPLPLHLTEYARERLRNDDDATFSRFADIFHHRLLSLFYRGWADAQPTVQYDRRETDRFKTYVGAMFGIGTESMQGRDAVRDNAKLHYAGFLACETKHVDGLQAMLSDFFDVPARLTEFVGRWIEIPESGRFVLGRSAATGSLGAAAPIGSQVWDCQQKFRITMGPLTLRQYERLLPGGDSLDRLVAIVRSYIGDELEWDLNLVLKKDEVPPMVLGQQGCLGWTDWLAHEGSDDDADDLFLDPLTQ